MQDTEREARAETGGEAGARTLAPTLTLLVVSLLVAGFGVYELCGFGLHSLDRRPHLFSDGLATGGVIVAAVVAGAAVGNLAWHLVTARRGTEKAGQGKVTEPATQEHVAERAG